jgi:hypothetical protein
LDVQIGNSIARNVTAETLAISDASNEPSPEPSPETETDFEILSTRTIRPELAM